MQFLALQQFVPQERKTCDSCIWCGQVAPANHAHIISRKLTTGARNAPTLRFNVCMTCNSTCGRLEEWILRFTPLSWVRMMLYLLPGSEATTRYVPSYFFSAILNDWVVFHLDGKTRSYVVSSQLILAPEFSANLLTAAPQELHEQLISRMIAALRDKSYNIDVRGSLPVDFSPRLLLDNERILLIARTDAESQRFTEHAAQLDTQARNAQRLRLENTGREQHHFQWSKANWTRFCAKTALETLCLFEGGGKCLRPAFQLVREFVLCGTREKGREIVFTEKGPRLAQDVPMPVFIDLTLGQAVPQPIAALLPHVEPGMHIVTLYEIRGWVIASVVFAGFPASVLILGGPDEHLADLYQLIYDDEEAIFDFTCLAYDQTKSVIPIPVPGDRFSDLAETYRLVGI